MNFYKRILIISLPLFFHSFLFSQLPSDQNLGSPDKKIKEKCFDIVDKYSELINIMKTDENFKVKRKKYNFFYQLYMVNGDMTVPSTPDSTDQKEIKLFSFVKTLAERDSSKVSALFQENQTRFSDVKKDLIREKYYLSAIVPIAFKWSTYIQKIDSSLTVDSVLSDSATLIKIDSSYLVDTAYILEKREISEKQQFHFSYKMLANTPAYFKLLGITEPGDKIEREPLPVEKKWWYNLSPEWQAIFRKIKTMEEYPTEYELNALLGSKKISVRGQKVSDLTVFKPFRDLRQLDAGKTQISSFDNLPELPRLEALDIAGTNITSLEGVGKFKKLNSLFCPKLGIVDAGPLSELPELIELDISDNKLEDVSPIAQITSLERLDISLNYDVENPEVLKSLYNLTDLKMRKVEFKNLEPLRGMPNLVLLDIFNCGTTSLEPIRNNQKIIYLDAGHNAIGSLEPIKNYPYLTELKVQSTGISDLSPLRGFSNLSVLDISQNRDISSLGPVHDLPSIKVLTAFATGIGKGEIKRYVKNHERVRVTYY